MYMTDNLLPTLGRRTRTPGIRELRRSTDVSFGLTPGRVIRILANANSGNTTDQSRLALEVLEKDPDIAQAINIRQLAISGTDWRIVPPEDDETELAAAVTEDIRQQVRGICPHPKSGLVSMRGLIKAATRAILPGFSCAEIDWSPSAGHINGFRPFAAHHFTLKDSNWPKLRTNNSPAGKDLPQNRWVTHTAVPNSGDLARGGLIRPLAYLYIFKHMGYKDFLRYLEKFGMPFITAITDADPGDDVEAGLSDDWNNLQSAIAAWGTDGGGIFKSGTDIKITEASKSSSDIYTQFLKMCKSQIDQLIIGQDSTSSSENSNRSTAAVHWMVKHEILVADCRDLEETIGLQVLAPLTRFRHGPDAPIPRIKFATEPAEDLEMWSQILANMNTAGFEPEDMDEINRLFGKKFKKKEIDNGMV